MKHLILGTAAVVALTLASSAHAGNGPSAYYYAQNNQYQAQPQVKRNTRNYANNDRWQERRALEIRRECDLYAFRYWRFHPDYRHCR